MIGERERGGGLRDMGVEIERKGYGERESEDGKREGCRREKEV